MSRIIESGALSLHVSVEKVSVHSVPLSIYSTLLMGPAVRLVADTLLILL